MIHNPPFIVILLRRWHAVVASKDPIYENYQLIVILADLLRRSIGHQPFDTFLNTYQLFLQSIPLETAKAAWGINAAAASARTHLSKP